MLVNEARRARRRTRTITLTLVAHRRIRAHDYSYAIDRRRPGEVFEAVEPDNRPSRWFIVVIDAVGIWAIPAPEGTA